MKKMFVSRRRIPLIWGLMLTLLLPLWSNFSYSATGATSVGTSGKVAGAHRKSTTQTARRAAAKRLKKIHQEKRQQRMNQWVNAHHGYTGKGG